MTRKASTPVHIDSSVTILLRTPLERWGVPAETLDNLNGSSDEASLDNAQNRLRSGLREEISTMSEQDRVLLTRWGEGAPVRQIASELNQPIATVYRRLAQLQKRILNRLLANEESSKATSPIPRLDAFKALRTKLQLTPMTASRWQDDIREARR